MFSFKMVYLLFLINVLCAFNSVKPYEIEEQVTVEQGTLEGFHKLTVSGFGYYAYLGIPYATPPIGELRFQDPQPATNWDDIIYNATSYGPECPQLTNNSTMVGNEDCLFLNIFVPNKTNTENKFPVMFWIHGGGFIDGNGGPLFFGPDYIVERDVILVTINYRVGALGFLSVFNEENHGNMGIKDQILALQWVNRNIEAFGGDSNSITIFGESAGGISVEILVVSLKSQGLYKRVINQSGPSLMECMLNSENTVKLAFAIGSKLGFDTEDPNELISFLKTVSAENIVRAARNVSAESGGELSVCPVIERELSSNPIMTKHPRELLLSGDFNAVDEILYGTCSQEGLLNLGGLVNWENETVDTLVPDFQKFIPFDIANMIKDDKREKAASLIKEFYFPNDENDLENFVDLQSDFYFNRFLQFSFQQISKKAQAAFYYTFSYHGVLNLGQRHLPIPYTGASHGDELGYLFTGMYSDFEEPTERDILTLDRMVEMWTNFAKYGNPTPEITDKIDVEWKPIDETHFYSLDIDDNLTLEEGPFAERMQFWTDLPELLNSGSTHQSVFLYTINLICILRFFQ